MIEKTQKIPPHYSAIRLLVSQTHNKTYVPLRTLIEASNHPDGVVIFEGDYGGTIYLTIPAAKVRCDELALKQALIDIDTMYWNDPDGRAVFFECLSIGSDVAGGMGGGKVIDGLWLHQKIEELDIRNEIVAVLDGQKKEIESKELRRK